MDNGQTATTKQPRPALAGEPAKAAGAGLDDTFVPRHIGPSADDVREMLQSLGLPSLEELVSQTVPAGIRLGKPLNIGDPRGEMEVLNELRGIASQNKVMRSFIGMGYYGTFTPPVVQRNVLENPGWYTQYTPYQAEIAQGRLEALLNFQTMVADLTGLPLANASLLDEATAAAEAMAMCRNVAGGGAAEAAGAADKNVFFVSRDCHPQTIAVVQTRARSMGVECVVGDVADLAAGFSDGESRFAGASAGNPASPHGNPPAAPLNPRAAPLNAGAAPTNPGAAPTNPGAISLNPGAASVNPGAISLNAGAAPTNPASIPGNATVPPGSPSLNRVFGVLVQYPTTDGRIVDYSDVVKAAHAAGALVVFATDLLALTLIKPPGEFGADIAVGSAQRFGVPMGFGGPHAAFMATKPEYARRMPGRIVGVSRDANGRPAYRLSLQTREQHIRREKATSNICTAQVLLAVMAGMYAVYHGPEGLRRIAERVHRHTAALARVLRATAHDVQDGSYFDTLRVRGQPGDSTYAARLLRRAANLGVNLRDYGDGSVGISLDETTTTEDLNRLVEVFQGDADDRIDWVREADSPTADFNPQSAIQNRKSEYLTHPVFNRYHSETEMLRYIRMLESRDLSLTHSMIPLGSCTMKLNATAEMFPVSWPAFAHLHPFAPADQSAGYQRLFKDLETWLAEITGFAAVSLQPNAGSQGEYAGLLAIRAWHESRGQGHRNVCLIPVSAHGTNPSSAVVAGMRVVPVACDDQGNVRLDDLRAKAEQHKDALACIMLTYPSTHGVFEEDVRAICRTVHDFGGQVYMDGANMNAQVGLTSPGAIGADVCHLNLHKTFCIPHGGGGPGMGPICVAGHLAPFLPGHPIVGEGTEARRHGGTKGEEKAEGVKVGPVSAAPYGSPSILVIPWVYIRLMGGPGLTRATEVAILNANYMAARLEPHYPILFKGKNGRVAHEFVMDCRQFEDTAGVKVEDIAKRLMDYGFHAPTMSWPVPGTLMVEPTESESKAELDRFCDAMIRIREEIRAVEDGRADRADNVLKGAPHTAAALVGDDWKHKYGRQQAAYPAPWVRDHKFWPAVGRIDNPYGDRNLVCTCPPVDTYDNAG